MSLAILGIRKAAPRGVKVSCIQIHDNNNDNKQFIAMSFIWYCSRPGDKSLEQILTSMEECLEIVIGSESIYSVYYREYSRFCKEHNHKPRV